MRESRHAVFMDRDGVLNEDRGYVSRPEDFQWLPGAVQALRWLKRAGWRLVIVTNQSGIARGLYGPAEYDNLTSWMESELAAQEVRFDGIYHCPHLRDAPLAAWRRQCECRKPQPGMLRRAARELDLDLASSVMIGDKPSDIAAGRAAKLAACIRIASAPAADASSPELAPNEVADYTCSSLAEAAYWLLSHQIERRA
jgi:D-glycero-D-manno-heptose 1,7-bisphosphate phosphatase